MHIIEVQNLTKDYGHGRGVFDVSIHVDKGEVFGFLGPNGAGKSTTIRHLMGFSKPDKGSTKIEGYETFNKYYEILNHVGYIPGEIALPQGLTGWEFLRMMQDLQKIHDEKRLNYLLDLFELNDIILKDETKRMSLGIKRKLAIVAAFMSDPDVLILDEPTSGLDPVMQEVFVKFIHEEKKRGKTILLSSHIFSEIDSTCDRIAIIKDGRIVSEFVADDLKHATRKFYTIEFNTNNDLTEFLDKVRRLSSFQIYNEEETKCFISIEDKELNNLIDLLSEYEVKTFSNKRESLEDYFMKFYKEDRDYGGAIK
ncbi:MAG: ABC transporter ATP-binding protein [Bacilli bacterium]|nr:ABC transporter ATP-binding protein [Bacilli bacterium]MDD7315520.1 ABC transporter ATP-binding protein [Bacilli bacterium]MDY4051899.1 ABC transporter ATP-binding protein [Bacilli bacterium]